MIKYLNLILCILLMTPATLVEATEMTAVNSCNVNYSVDIIDSKTIKGTGNNEKPVELYVNEQFVEETIVSGGEYRFTLSTALEDEDKVKLISENNTLSIDYKIDAENTKSFDDIYQCETTEESSESDDKDGTETEGTADDKEATDTPEKTEESSESDDKDATETEDTADDKEATDTPESNGNKEEDTLDDFKEETKIVTRSTAERQFEAGKCPTPGEYNTQNSNLIGTVISKSVTGEVRCVSTDDEFNKAIDDRSVEVILFTKDISTNSNQYIYSNYNQKILDGNGHSFNIGSSRLYNTSISEITVMNFSNLSTTNRDKNEGMFRSNHPSQLRLKDVAFNGGHIGASWESVLHVYGNVTINASADYAAFYRFYEIHNGANFTVNGALGGLYAQSNNKENVQLNGIRVGENAVVNVTANNGVALYSRGVYQKYVESGANSRLFLKSLNSNAVQFSDDKDFFITAHHDGEIILESLNSPVTSQGIGAITVDDQGSLIVRKTSNTNAPLFSTNSAVTLNVYYPNVVDFDNMNGPIFPTNNALKTFNVNYVSMEGYDTQNNTPDYKTNMLNGTFTMSGNTTNADSSIINVAPNFNNEFKSTLKRIRMIGDIKVSLKVNEPVTDEITKITGTATANRKIKMLNTRTNKVYETTSDSTGKFTFNNIPNGDLKGDDKLKFFVVVDKYEILSAEVIVEGTILELLPVEDIVFEDTEITNVPELIIKRKSNPHKVKVRSTKKSDFSVSVYSKTPLTHTNGIDQLQNALYFVKNKDFKLIEGEVNRQTVGKKSDATKNGDEFQFNFNEDEGILLKTNPATAQRGSYQSTLVWTLTDGP